MYQKINGRKLLPKKELWGSLFGAIKKAERCTHNVRLGGGRVDKLKL